MGATFFLNQTKGSILSCLDFLQPLKQNQIQILGALWLQLGTLKARLGLFLTVFQLFKLLFEECQRNGRISCEKFNLMEGTNKRGNISH